MLDKKESTYKPEGKTSNAAWVNQLSPFTNKEAFLTLERDAKKYIWGKSQT